ncbi:protein LplC [Paenibacillus baekrokdamisoli]|uniref:Protein LplC n=1 Tax=Paenibacillus baekrokdamisoli TaxID=1712516 RepID=A0A3G9J238_9BACL|nr:carbohydrate ABC transporter permease [Paenibacillus baekrokdamisoli]MBB3071341.1 putative aldouronate transport system permease protein [Paenibacillus baekrokdamisoli]BBH24622.1 protein LplC [Paenibacillus baekrokdamisoli]
MPQSTSLSRKIFNVLNYTFLIGISLLCLLPLIHVLAVSLSSNTEASAGIVKLWPVGFTFKSYEFVLAKKEFVASFLISVERVALGTVINMFFTILMAYPLSKEVTSFKWRTVYVWGLFVSILFSGGLIPWYMTIRATGLLDTIWALLIPSAVPVFNVILLLNFFRNLPKELEEASFMDGAGHFTTLFRIFVPLSMPALATLILFTVVGHWNSWFDGLILMNSPDHYPMQSYLQTVVIQKNFTSITEQEIKMLAEINDRTLKAAQIFMGSLPILLVYPFLQKYFIKGIVIGSVKE